MTGSVDMQAVDMGFDEFLMNEGVPSGDVAILVKELKIDSVNKLRNCVATKEEFVEDVWSILVTMDTTKKTARRGAVLAAYDKAVAMGEAERMAQMREKLKEAEMELAAAEAARRVANLNGDSTRTLEMSMLNDQTEVIKQMMKEKQKKVRMCLVNVVM